MNNHTCNPTLMITDFYGLEDIILRTDSCFTPSISSLNRDARSLHLYLTHKMARVLEDYFTITCAAEMYHAEGYCEKVYPIIPSVGKHWDHYDRVVFMTQFTKESLLQAAVKIFDCDWTVGRPPYLFGGKRWRNISQVTLDKVTGKIDDRTFFDTAISIWHNCSIAITKGYPLKPDVITYEVYKLLEKKKYGSILSNSLIVSSAYTFPIFKRAKNLNIIRNDCKLFVDECHGFPEVTFGNKIFDCELVLNKEVMR